ncbi:LytR/AlgR family response regulator transcription factor [Arcticibacterium luteifluviistationis]|uniref:DNA-binding response regulator n=1 Tax=Arcticibacterium luteifluviistationis TaxID=1784714 RepID=A0A2Z4GH45_9BACT|nr:response regulator [Arcticibacterium luteifluviistationis]AWW00345.1 DNA-binding response regulator [Arcticibacterium luteifluviistationis]
MINPITILVVEDEMIIAAKISLRLTNLGYEVTGIVPRGEEALLHIEQNAPDIVLLDINLKGSIDGIDTATQIIKSGNQCVIIYLTANNDEATFNRAKTTRPFAFLSKPIKPVELQRTLELCVERILKKREIEEAEDTSTQESSPSEEVQADGEFLSDRIFVKHKDKMVKIFVSDILYIAAERSYCQIFTKKDEYLLSVPLKNVEDKLLKAQFMRIHRSYLVNIKEIDEMTDSHVYIGKRAIPINSSAKEDLFKRLQRV